MNILYCRVSTIEQKTDRQRVDEKSYDLVIEDKCSGKIPFFDREGGKEILKFTNNNILKVLSVWEIDRLGRDLRDIINTIHFFNQKGVCIHFVSQNLHSLNNDGLENPISKLIISILGIVGEMERTQIKERQLEGIRIGKLKGVYNGRKKGSKESVLDFLNKPKNKSVIDYLKKGYTGVEISKIVCININTITNIKEISTMSKS
jgi:DNA invertase Pin-like site-specific DNA recombinase